MGEESAANFGTFNFAVIYSCGSESTTLLPHLPKQEQQNPHACPTLIKRSFFIKLTFVSGLPPRLLCFKAGCCVSRHSY